MLRKIRLTLAWISFVLITLLFLDFTGTLHAWFGWMAKMQFLPAVLALNIAVMLFLIILTLLFGRIYCSIICPLGIFQDIIAWFGRMGKKLPYSYSPAKKWMRYGFFVFLLIACIAGVGSVVALLDPYAAYGRIANNFLMPIWQWGNNVLANIAERTGSYAFYTTDVWLKGIPVFIVAIATFIMVVILAWRNGRTYCNTVCPVGTLLGFVSRFSLMRIVIDSEKCNQCSVCARTCKASCIDYKNAKVDNSRCVSCMNCVGKCKQGAIEYKFIYSKSATEATAEKDKAAAKDSTRRGFLSAVLLLVASRLRSQTIAKAEDVKVDGGLADIAGKEKPERATYLTPPGSASAKNMKQHCTACQLCVTACDNQVLRPSTGFLTFMQPEMSFERGYCRPECIKCSAVCPAGAIRKMTIEEKSSTQIGHAVWVRERCLPITDGYECGNCERHCPVTAITMIPSIAGDDKSLKIPAVNEERCIGCGACENLCPSRPLSAIYVEGHQIHKTV